MKIVAYGVFVAVLVTVASLVIGAIATPIYAIVYKTQKSECAAFERESGFETKWKVLVDFAGLPISWDCFALTNTGKWVPKSRLREDD